MTHQKWCIVQQNASNVASEIFANISAIDALDYDSKQEFKSIFKELYEAYRGIVE